MTSFAEYVEELEKQTATAVDLAKPDPSGLQLNPEEREALAAVPPGQVSFRPSGYEDWGDIYLDTFNVGWYQRKDAERAAAHYGVELNVLPAATPYQPKNPRRGL